MLWFSEVGRLDFSLAVHWRNLSLLGNAVGGMTIVNLDTPNLQESTRHVFSCAH